MTQALSERTNPVVTPPATLIDWIQAALPFPALAQTTKELTQLAEVKPDAAAADRTPLALSAGRLALEAQQRAITEWYQLKTWKDRVRTVRGRSRLCGTAMDYPQSSATSSGTEARFALSSSGA